MTSSNGYIYTIYLYYALFFPGRWKETLNSDGQQIHQYQQNKQSHLPLTH